MISPLSPESRLETLTFFARHVSPSSSSFLRLLPALILSSFSPLLAKVRSTSHILTSSPFPATAKEVEDEEAVARQVTGAGSVRDWVDDEEDGWYVNRPDERADMAPLDDQSDFISCCSRSSPLHPCETCPCRPITMRDVLLPLHFRGVRPSLA